MKRLFSKQSEQLGTTDVLAHWRDSDLLAVAGSKVDLLQLLLSLNSSPYGPPLPTHAFPCPTLCSGG